MKRKNKSVSDKVNFYKLLKIVKILRRKCPWDKEQTLESIRRNIVEEAYELVDAINSGDKEKIMEEVGDLLLQSIFVSQIAEGFEKNFLGKSIRKLIKKLIRNHPHVFGNERRKDAEEVLKSWILRKKEPISFPQNLPSTLLAENFIKRVGKIEGDKFQEIMDIKEKMKEKIGMKDILKIFFSFDNLEPEVRKEIISLIERYKTKGIDAIREIFY